VSQGKTSEGKAGHAWGVRDMEKQKIQVPPLGEKRGGECWLGKGRKGMSVVSYLKGGRCVRTRKPGKRG